jgi:hypothetical protein
MTRKSFGARRANRQVDAASDQAKGEKQNNGSNGGSRTPRRSLNSVHRNAGCCPFPAIARAQPKRRSRVATCPRHPGFPPSVIRSQSGSSTTFPRFGARRPERAMSRSRRTTQGGCVWPMWDGKCDWTDGAALRWESNCVSQAAEGVLRRVRPAWYRAVAALRGPGPTHRRSSRPRDAGQA